MSSTAEETASRAKLAKLAAAFQRHLGAEFIEAILQTEGDVNYAIPYRKQLESIVVEAGTVLHQLKTSYRGDIPKVVELLLRHDVEITKRNSQGQTALHAKTVYLLDKNDVDREDGGFNNPIVESILSAHVDHSIRANPCDNNGISHFHIACMTRHAKAVEFFLDNGVNVDQAISRDSPIFPGYSPLHLAVQVRCRETTKKLLDHGANVCSRNAKGFTPTHVLISRNLKITNMDSDYNFYYGKYRHSREEYKMNQRMIDLLLSKSKNNNNNGIEIVTDEYGFSNFHAACSIDDITLAQSLLVHIDDVNRTVGLDSPFCPGYSPLHFAAHFSLDLVKLLLENRANLMAKDAKGVTPLEICCERYAIEDVMHILSTRPAWKDIVLSDNRTKLFDLLRAMESEAAYRTLMDRIENINCHVNADSTLWPGYTMLHFLVLFYKRLQTRNYLALRSSDVGDRREEDWPKMIMVQEFIANGADFTLQDSRGCSPLQLAFYSRRESILTAFLEHGHKMVNPIDENNLSHLHIACAKGMYGTTRNLTLNGANVNLPTRVPVELVQRILIGRPEDLCVLAARSTPLHMTVCYGNVEIANFLMQHGANLNATNEEGWSPLHCVMLLESPEEMGKTLLTFTAKLREQVVEHVGLSHLHVACHVDSLRGVRKLIELGSDVNAVVRFDPTPPTEEHADCRSALDLLRQINYAGFTPLRFAVKCGSVKIATVLLEAGADVLARNAKGVSILQEVLMMGKRNEQLVDLFVEHLWDNESLKERLEEESGVTLLHVCVFRMVVEEVDRAEVNAKVKVDSSLWPGCTALHTWAYGAKNRDLRDDDVKITLKALLDAGADVTISNKMLDTPLHLFDRSFPTIADNITLSTGRQLLSGQKDFGVNPTNTRGISHFHIAARMRNVAVAEEFLKRGVDFDQQIDVLSDNKPGCSALHLLAYCESTYLDELPARMQTIDLLLSHGVDVRARDVHGNTPLHALARGGVMRREIAEKIIQAGGELDAVNVDGDTPFAVALKSIKVSAKEVEFFLKHGCRVNAYNAVDQTGLLASLFVPADRTIQQLNEVYRALFRRPALMFVDESGRTAIHNIVSSRAKTIFGEFWIEKLVNIGSNIDAQNQSGKTALHMAAYFKNERGLSALLMHGADVNIIDNEGKTAFDYAVEACTCSYRKDQHYHEHVIKSIGTHVKKLRLLKLDVHERNESSYRSVRKDIDTSVSLFFNQVRSTRHVEVVKSQSLSLRDFLSETGAVAAYWSMSRAKQDAIDKFFTENGKTQMESIGEVMGLLKLQYRKAVRRASLVESAFESLWTLSGIRLPAELCCEMLRYLSLTDVESLIASMKN